MKRGMLQLLQNLAASVFIGVAVYGAITYWGGETTQKVPVLTSLLLGALAVVCVAVIVMTGGLQDRIAEDDDKDRGEPL